MYLELVACPWVYVQPLLPLQVSADKIKAHQLSDVMVSRKNGTRQDDNKMLLNDYAAQNYSNKAYHMGMEILQKQEKGSTYH